MTRSSSSPSVRTASAALLALVAAGAMASCGSDGDAAKPKETVTTTPASAAAGTPLTVERRIEGTMRARVRAVDQVTRQVTLEDEQMHAITFTAGPAVKRLDEVRPGDYVDVSYSASLIAELRPPTAEELAAPISAVGISGRAAEPSDPAGAAARGFKVVTTVEAIDIPNMRLTLKGPMGDSMTVRARSEENMRKLAIGDTIVITYMEAIAASLDKAIQ